MSFETDFMKLYEELGQLNETKNKNFQNKDNAASNALIKAIQENCTRISELIPGLPDKVDDYEILVSNKFKRDYKDFKKKHKDVIGKINEKLNAALSGMSNGVPDAPVDQIALGTPKTFYELKIGRFRDKQEARAVYFTEEVKAVQRKFFILGSFFIHADSKLTQDEKESAVGTYKNIQNSL